MILIPFKNTFVIFQLSPADKLQFELFSKLFEPVENSIFLVFFKIKNTTK